MNMETVIPIAISSISLALSIFKYLDKSKERINKALMDIELMKLQIDQVSKWGDHVEKNLLGKIEDQKEQAEKLSEKLDEIRDKLNE
jgi:hypothetical protein